MPFFLTYNPSLSNSPGRSRLVCLFLRAKHGSEDAFRPHHVSSPFRPECLALPDFSAARSISLFPNSSPNPLVPSPFRVFFELLSHDSGQIPDPHFFCSSNFLPVIFRPRVSPLFFLIYFSGPPFQARRFPRRVGLFFSFRFGDGYPSVADFIFFHFLVYPSGLPSRPPPHFFNVRVLRSSSSGKSPPFIAGITETRIFLTNAPLPCALTLPHRVKIHVISLFFVYGPPCLPPLPPVPSS